MMHLFAELFGGVHAAKRSLTICWPDFKVHNLQLNVVLRDQRCESRK